MIQWPHELVIEIARRRSVVFIGAGVSAQCTGNDGSQPKSWRGLLEAAVHKVPGAQVRKKEIRDVIRAGDYLTACEVIREKMGSHSFSNFLIQELLTPNFQPAPIHDTLIQLGSRIYATPNFDKIFENKAATLPSPAVRVKNYYEEDIAAVAKATTTIILKVHGTIDVPDRMIFTRADYIKARNEHRAFYSVLEALSMTHTFLFLGCGLNDPDIKLMLEDHAFTHKWAAPHYFVHPAKSLPPWVASAIERSLNIRFLQYTGGYVQLKPELDELVSLVNQERTKMQVDRSW
jgi:hypothetical protein